jgi:FAD/FMN-containing dehydrogenase
MPSPSISIADIPARVEELSSYSGLHRTDATVFLPQTLAHLVSLLAHAREQRLPVTVHGSGLSLDEQGIGRGIVVSLRAFRSVAVNAAAAEATAEAGATWAEVLHALPAGLVPRIVVTSQRATVGGTLSANSLSRFSPVFGRERDTVLAFDLLLADGTVRHCRRDNEHARLFAAIGGFGFLGIVLRVTYRLLDVRPLISQDGGSAVDTVSVQTTAARHASMVSLGRDLLAVRPQEGVYSVAGLDGRGVVLRSRYVARAPVRPMPVHRPYGPARLILEWLLWLPGVNPLLWWIIFSLYYRLRTHFVDDLRYYTFMMDGNQRALTLARRLGLPLRVVQQTYLLPASRLRVDDSAQRLQAFVENLNAALRRNALRAQLLDIFFVAEAPGADQGHFAVTLAFVALRGRRVSRILATLDALSEICRSHGGRVHLVKNVQAAPACLATMYGAAHRDFLTLKQAVDPQCLFHNGFFTRVFLDPAGAAAT